jgi:Leucine-rich repeat (LRR) protein
LLLFAYLAAAGVVVKWFLKDFVIFEEQNPGAFWVTVLGPILFIIAFDSFPRLVNAWRQKQREAIALKPGEQVDDEYFRLDPYVKESPTTFSREDRAHQKVLDWVRRNDQPLLFLSGASGAGKSSVLQGYVLPMLQKEGWRVVEVRGFTGPLERLEDALRAPRRRGVRLLVIFDQFEEFIILEGQATGEQRQQFLSRVRELHAAAPPGVCLLFAFRSDYQSAVIALDLSDLSSRSTWMEIAPFERGAARRFLENAPQRPSTLLVNRMLDGADALDDASGLYRPVVLNMLGLILRRSDQAFTGRPERVVQAYLEAAIAEKPIRDIVPRIIKEMITNATTTQAQSVTKLSTATGLREPDVIACLNRLAAHGLARRLGDAGGLWELSHDFVARQFTSLLTRLHPWRHVTAVVSPVVFVIALAGAVFGVVVFAQSESSRTRAQISDLGLSISSKDDWLSITPSAEFTSDTLSETGPLLAKLASRIHTVDLSGKQVADIEPLKGLTALQNLDLSGTQVANIEPLKDLTALQSLNLSKTKANNLEPLRGLTALRSLDLSLTPVDNLEPLKGLTALQSLSVFATQVDNLEPLKGLTALQSLNLDDTHVDNLEPLKGLTALQSLSVFGTPVDNLEPLMGLTALRSLNLGDTQVDNLKPLKGLTALRRLNLGKTKVDNLEALQGLTALQWLSLDGTKVANIEPLKGLTALQSLILSDTPVDNLEPLKGLTALQWLSLDGTKVDNLEQLKGLTRLKIFR